MTDELKTPGAWCAELGYEVLDPDGWRGSEGRPWTDPITRAEFEERLVTCTQRKVPPKKANDEFREQQEAERKVGLKARHETRVERAIRRQAGEEIAQAIEAHDLADSIWHGQHIRQCAAIAREIANRETS